LWLVLSYLSAKSLPTPNPWDWYVRGAITIAGLALGTYLQFYLKRRYFDTRQYRKYALLVILGLIVSALVSYGLHQLYPITPHSLLQDFINMVFTAPIALGIQYLKRGVIGQFQLQELKAKTAQTELNLLKAQINPHFLFNTLNNIYATNQEDSERGSEMIMELADVMRYHLRFSKLEHVTLEEEVELIRSYVALEKLRLSDNCQVKLEVLGDLNGATLAPLLLLPYVENAFKHGTHSTASCFVTIRIQRELNAIRTTIENSIVANKRTVKTHVGMENVRRRLEILYPQRDTLQVTERSGIFRVQLHLPL